METFEHHPEGWLHRALPPEPPEPEDMHASGELLTIIGWQSRSAFWRHVGPSIKKGLRAGEAVRRAWAAFHRLAGAQR